MSEKKLTKAQQKALETANRRSFVNNIAIVAMTDILDQAESIRKTLDVKMRYQNYNRYIFLHKYCFDVSLLFYKDGNIVVKIKDQTTGANYNEVLFEYSADEKAQERALDMVDMLVTWLVPRFIEVELTEIHEFVSKIIQYDLMNLCAMEMEAMENIEASCN